MSQIFCLYFLISTVFSIITALWLSHTLPTYIELPLLLTMPLYAEIRFFSQTNHSILFSISEREVSRMKTSSMKYCDFFLNYPLLLDPSRKDFSFSVRGTFSCHKPISFPSPFLLSFLKTNEKTALRYQQKSCGDIRVGCFLRCRNTPTQHITCLLSCFFTLPLPQLFLFVRISYRTLYFIRPWETRQGDDFAETGILSFASDQHSSIIYSYLFTGQYHISLFQPVYP
jgi:hypothetical protein